MFIYQQLLARARDAEPVRVGLIGAGKFGAMFSRMGQALLDESHQKALQDGNFTDEDVRSIIMWLDMNSNEFTAYKDLDAQRRGEIVWPEFDVDPNNISGVEGAETPAGAE